VGEKSLYEDLSRHNGTPRHKYFTAEREGLWCFYCHRDVEVGSVAVRFPPHWAVRHLECKAPKRVKRARSWRLPERL
jgi:hypothetical protein